MREDQHDGVLRTDTVEIRVIDGEVCCGWCRIKLTATPTPPVDFEGTLFHEVCVGAMEKLRIFTRR